MKGTGKYRFPTYLLLSCLISPGWADEQAVFDSLRRVLPDARPDAVRKTPVPGLYEVNFGPRIFYVTEDGRYLIQGSLVDLSTMNDLTARRRAVLVGEAMASLEDDRTIIFPAKDERYRVTVFTDIDCGYCRRLHSQVAEYNALGITIRYAFFPRAGRGSESWKKAVAVWCSKDRQKALTEAKQGRPLDTGARCEHPVEQHMRLVERLGLRGTPAIVFPGGDILPGYVPPARLLGALEKRAEAARGPSRKAP